MMEWKKLIMSSFTAHGQLMGGNGIYTRQPATLRGVAG